MGMKMKEEVTTLRTRLTKLITGMGYEFVGYELLRQRKQALLRIFIDSQKGVTLDDCSRVSHQVSAMLDVEDPIQGHYSLEISSPGINRPLFELAHYQKYLGAEVKVRLLSPLNQRRNFVGVLLQADESGICLLIGAEKVEIPFSSIEKANVIADLRNINR